MLREQDKEVILAMAEYGMNISEAARSLRYHRNSVSYHLMKIHAETGLNPKDFYDLQRLVDMAKDGED